jgi:hypothetical protein
MRRLLPLCLLAATLVLGALPAAAQETPTFRTERVYFTCIGDNKLQNVPMLEGQIPSWDTTAPGSVATGSGCGMYENNQNTTGLNAEFQGTFTGNLDNLTVELHNIYASPTRPDHSIRMIATLTIDDEPIADTAAASFPTVASATGISEKLTYTFTELNYDDEAGDGSQVHTIFIQARSSGTETQSLWVWDAAEVPSGITFNPTTLEGTQIPVNRP